MAFEYSECSPMKTNQGSVFHQESNSSNTSASKNKKMISLTKLPYSLQRHLMDKLTAPAFANLMQTNSYTENWCQKIEKRCKLNVNSIDIKKNKWKVFVKLITHSDYLAYQHLRWQRVHRANFLVQADRLYVHDVLTKQLCYKMIKKFRQTQSKVQRLVLFNDINCPVEILEEMLKTIGVKEFVSSTGQSGNLLLVQSIQKMDCLDLFVTNCSPEALISLKCKDISLSGIDIPAHIIISYINQWRCSERELKSLELNLQKITIDQFEALLPQIGANVVWSPETHKDSIFSSLDINDLYFNNIRLYSIQQKETGAYFLLRLYNSSLVFDESGHEMDYLMNRLKTEQYFQITGKYPDWVNNNSL